MEQLRVIKEMRKATNGRYPKYMVWENVCGSFSSKGGRDFAAVLTETARVVEENAPDISVPEKGWKHAGVIVGERFNVRRLTPTECERLQGYPDGWTDIGEYTDTKGRKCKTSDAARYKALGNSIALPHKG